MKKIGISLRVQNIQPYNEKRDSISQDWMIFLQKLNLMPILIPNNIDNIGNYISELKLDGIILSGGDNIGDFPERDVTEKNIIEIAEKSSIPIIGICRGMQVINNFFGGKLTKKDDEEHINNNHGIVLSDDFQFSNTNSIIVNSYHNNIIEFDDLGKNLIPFAKHENDNTIEGFRHIKLPIIGVMWHPERKQDENSIKLFKEIF